MTATRTPATSSTNGNRPLRASTSSVLDHLVPHWKIERPSYFPAVDGLRALSVIAVIAYHLDISWATGGYLGVEVFFVVSGFLITRIIISEHEHLGHLRRARFWMRRARRLLPAVVALIIGVMAWSAWVLGDDRFTGDGLASLLYVQNWHLIFTDAPYFDTITRPSPLRHLWSLAIEEQFYFVWPIVLPIFVRRLRRSQTVAIMAGATMVSILLMSLLADISAPERAYYGTDTRMFAILAGALVATMTTDSFETARRRRRWLDLLAFVAVVVLVRQLLVRSEFDPWTFPWGFVLVDVCTVIIIAAGLQPSSTVHRVLGRDRLRAIGLRSYSLYLWHWPVIAFTQPSDWDIVGEHAIIIRLIFIVALAELSYRYVEVPIRYGRTALTHSRQVRQMRGLHPWWATGAALATVVGLIATAGFARAQYDDTNVAAAEVTRATVITTTTTTTTTTPTTAPEQKTRTATPTTTTTKPAAKPAPKPPPTVTVLGESVTLGAASAFGQVYGDRVRVDAVEGRSFNDGVARLEQLAAEKTLGKVVVVHVGNNGAVPTDGMERIHNAVGEKRTLMLVTVRVPRRWEAQVNGEIAKAAERWKNVAIIDWNKVANSEEGLLLDDGVHLSKAGQVRYAELVRKRTG